MIWIVIVTTDPTSLNALQSPLVPGTSGNVQMATVFTTGFDVTVILIASTNLTRMRHVDMRVIRIVQAQSFHAGVGTAFLFHLNVMGTKTAFPKGRMSKVVLNHCTNCDTKNNIFPHYFY